jgi:hypothetical protein
MRGPLGVFVPALLLLTSLVGAAPGPQPPQPKEEFFILSSLDVDRSRVVLKRPTEVTLVLRVDGQTLYRDERDRPLALKDLRAGDTVYISLRQNPGGEPVALLVRKGMMTVEELQRRYLRRAE